MDVAISVECDFISHLVVDGLYINNMGIKILDEAESACIAPTCG